MGDPTSSSATPSIAVRIICASTCAYKLPFTMKYLRNYTKVQDSSEMQHCCFTYGPEEQSLQ